MEKSALSPRDATRQQKLIAFDRLLTIMDELRLNCPWDKKQTIESLRHLTIEETFELSEAIISGDLSEIQGELGDLLLHLVFYARIGSETNDFDMTDIINSVCDKLIRRHPHIYGDTKATDEETVKRNWEQIKLQEKGRVKKTVLGGVPKSLPPLIKAFRMQEKTKGVGFEWDTKEQVWEKVKEELAEFEEELKTETKNGTINNTKVTQEFGDLLFSLVNYARYIGVNPEEALQQTNAKFKRRFDFVENKAEELGKSLQEMSLHEMDKYWVEAKKLE